ncbi:hypothetical protein [Sphingomonas bacterium]|uniref:hypothetical protein n=1 Tax=Sphingomonas bacterium TaxID=1895847 RepID=UPI001577617E|nr:hypothetical protein [Sphingomonas bacterium]
MRQTLSIRKDWTICCVIDRDDIVAASKFVVCARSWSRFYQKNLRARFPTNVWGMPANFSDGPTLVLAREPRLAEI